MTAPVRSGRWRRLAIELPATIASLAVAAVVEVGLRATTLPRLARFLGCPLAASARDAASAPPDSMSGAPTTLTPRQKRQVRATRRVLRHWRFGDTCLRQALVTGQRLRGLHPVLHVGVARIDGEIRAHAWLVINGGVLDPLAAASSYQDLIVPRERRTE